TEGEVEGDATGAYRLFDLPAGDFVVGISGPRMLGGAGGVPTPRPIADALRNFYPHAAQVDGATLLHVTAGQELAGIDLSISGPPSTMMPATPAPVRQASRGTIRGRVVDAEGHPVRQAKVELSSTGRFSSPVPGATDDDGAYELDGVEPGEYLLSVTTPRYETARFGARRAGDRGDVITVARGSVVEHVDV